jgi:magnesium-protoporphyrin O-methyltransferase
MSCCCHCEATAEQFGPKSARRDVDRYHRRGPDATTRLLIDGLRAASAPNASLLDIGGGIGVLHHELLEDTVDRVTHVDASPAYMAAAREEDERRGRPEAVEYVFGDGADLSDTLEPADIVTLDRVICCYPDWRRLVRGSASKARRLYAFSLPHDRWYLRFAVRLINLSRRLVGSAFRAFVHPVADVDRMLEEMGFRQVLVERTLVWRVEIYEAVQGTTP